MHVWTERRTHEGLHGVVNVGQITDGTMEGGRIGRMTDARKDKCKKEPTSEGTHGRRTNVRADAGSGGRNGWFHVGPDGRGICNSSSGRCYQYRPPQGSGTTTALTMTQGLTRAKAADVTTTTDVASLPITMAMATTTTTNSIRGLRTNTCAASTTARARLWLRP